MRINWRSKATIATIAVMAAALTIPALSAGDGKRAVVEIIGAELKGQNEVPGPGDPNGRGNVEIKLKKNKQSGKKKVCFDLAWRKLSGANAAHIHKGGEDVAGPIKLLLFEADPELPGEDRVRECVRPSSKLFRKLKRSPEKYYVNVHNAEYPDGAIRGQLALVAD
jgi:CHRD domain-containing protein